MSSSSNPFHVSGTHSKNERRESASEWMSLFEHIAGGGGITKTQKRSEFNTLSGGGKQLLFNLKGFT